MKRSKWDQRIQRADELAVAHSFAAEAMSFYAGVATFQKELYAHVDAARGNGWRKKAAGLFNEDLNLPVLLPKFPEFLSRVSAFSPRPVAECAANLRIQPSARFEELARLSLAGNAKFSARSQRNRSTAGLDISTAIRGVSGRSQRARAR